MNNFSEDGDVSEVSRAKLVIYPLRRQRAYSMAAGNEVQMGMNPLKEDPQ